jgi:hypothetical protein
MLFQRRSSDLRGSKDRRHGHGCRTGCLGKSVCVDLLGHPAKLEQVLQQRFSVVSTEAESQGEWCKLAPKLVNIELPSADGASQHSRDVPAVVAIGEQVHDSASRGGNRQAPVNDNVIAG